jgi:hypothetical protein
MRVRNPWLRVGFDAWALAFEASSVIGLRALKIAAGGPSAEREARRMFSEKFAAGVALQTKALTGGLGLTAPTAAAKTLLHLRRKVRANRKRLTKNKK